MSVLTSEGIAKAILQHDIGVAVEVDGALLDIDSQALLDEHVRIGAAKLDIHIGSQYALYSDARDQMLGYNTRTLEKGRSLTLVPGDGIVIRSRESLRMPADVAGLVSSKVGLVTLGLSPISTTLDPTFQGFLIITFWNMGGLEINLEYGDTIASVTLFRTEGVVTGNAFGRAQHGTLFDIMWTTMLKDFMTKGHRTASADELRAIIQELEEAGAWRGSPFVQLHRAISELANEVAGLKARHIELSEAIDNLSL